MFLKIRLLFKKYDVTLWVKQLKNVAHTFFAVSPVHMDCIKPKKFALGSILEKLVHIKSKVLKRKKFVFFRLNVFYFSTIGTRWFKVIRETCVSLMLAMM